MFLAIGCSNRNQRLHLHMFLDGSEILHKLKPLQGFPEKCVCKSVHVSEVMRVNIAQIFHNKINDFVLGIGNKPFKCI